MRQFLSLGLALTLAWIVSSAAREPSAERWYKGNTHTHTLWSDGNGAPELVADWYASRDYNFLVLSDHNLLSEGEKWFPIGAGRLTPEKVDQLKREFGDDWVKERTVDQKREMRLKTLSELQRKFGRPGEFTFIQGEEITDDFKGRPVHVNGVNLQKVIRPRKGATLRETLQNNIDAVMEQSRKFKKPMLAHVNHPNFQWGITPEDLASISGEQFFEVYNGHSGVRNQGDETHPSMELMWDIALCSRLRDLDLPVLYGLATDDSHEYFQFGLGKTNPGRGWVMVKARELSPDAIVKAMRRGDFYSSSGVSLLDIKHKMNSHLSVTIDAEEGLTYTTQFIGTRVDGDDLGQIGEVLFETTENPARYEFTGDELYVRAKVISPTDHPNPYAAGDKQCAWVQPVTRPLF
jgi:hypothetical protein